MKRIKKRLWAFPALFLMTTGELSAQCNAAGTHTTENYSSTTGWYFSDYVTVGGTTSTICSGTAGTLSNGSISFASNKLNFVTARGGRELRAHRSLAVGLNNTSWTADFTFTLNAPPAGGLANNAPSAYLLALTGGYDPIRTSCTTADYPNTCSSGYPNTNQDGVWVLLNSNIPSDCTSSPTQTNWSFIAQSRNGNGTINSSAPIALTSATTFYIRLQRTWQTRGMLSVYSDANYTNLIDAVCFDIDPEVKWLTTLQHGIVEQGNQYRVLNASISNVRIDDGVTCPLSLTPSFTYPSSVCIGSPITVNGSASFGTPDAESHHFWAIAECDANGVVLGTPGTDWSHWYEGEAGSFTFPDVANGGPDFITCGKYYSIKLALQNCGNVWSEVSHVVFVRCGPRMSYEEPAPICAGSSATLSVSGAQILGCVWNPGSVSGLSMTVSPSATTTYTATATNIYGCTKTVSMTLEVVPSLLDVDLSTGVNDLTSGMIPVGQNDDTWKKRGIPGSLNTGPHALLSNATVVAPYSWDPFHNWYPSSTVRWISIQSDGSGNPQEVPASQNDNTYPEDNHYHFEKQVNIHQKYNNLRIEASELAVDNEAWLFINAGFSSGSSVYSITGQNPTNFSTNHNPGTIATSQSLYYAGLNTFRFRVKNGGGPIWNGSYMGLLFKGRLKGECDPLKMLVIEPQDQHESLTESIKEINDALEIFPSPNNGIFTISSPASTIQQLVITDITGKMIEEIKNVNASKVDMNLSAHEDGIYLVKTWMEGNPKPIVKKVVVNK